LHSIQFNKLLDEINREEILKYENIVYNHENNEEKHENIVDDQLNNEEKHEPTINVLVNYTCRLINLIFVKCEEIDLTMDGEIYNLLIDSVNNEARALIKYLEKIQRVLYRISDSAQLQQYQTITTLLHTFPTQVYYHRPLLRSLLSVISCIVEMPSNSMLVEMHNSIFTYMQVLKS
jgi:hypothetical protein